MSPSQNDMGRAFEYSLALSLSNILPAPINQDQHSLTAQKCFITTSLGDIRTLYLDKDNG